VVDEGVTFCVDPDKPPGFQTYVFTFVPVAVNVTFDPLQIVPALVLAVIVG
jgi:hypothetical protein